MLQVRRWMLLVLVVCSVSGCLLVGPTTAQPAPATAGEPATDTTTTQNLTRDVPPPSPSDIRPPADGEPATTRVDTEQTAIIEVHPNGTDSIPTLEQYGVTIDEQSNHTLQVTLPAENRSAVARLPWVRTVREPRYAVTHEVSEGVAVTEADRLHEQGLTGADVKVGVIDTGFAASNPEIRDNIVASRSFTGDLSNGGDSKHGTAVSEIIVDTAPDSELYVANVNTMVEFAAAVDWLIEQDVAVISVSLGWYAGPHDGSSLASQKATQATEHGITFVSASGNSAQRHWQGSYTDPDGDSLANIAGSREANYLNEGEPFAGPVDVSLMWDDWAAPSEDYDLYLMNAQNQIVARSERPQSVFGVDPVERISTSVPYGQYYVVIRNYDASGREQLELFASQSNLQFQTATSSIHAPAVAVNTTAVGAVQYSATEIEPYSSQGPTNDGRRGVDFTGPTAVSTTAYSGPFAGTSAAAPHVAGIAALLNERNPALAPTDVERVLGNTATDMNRPGPDTISGYGHVDAAAAAQQATGDIQVTEFTLSESSVAVTDQLVVTATVTNDGVVAGNATIAYTINGTTTQHQQVSLAPGERTTITFVSTFQTAGLRSIAVGELEPQQVTVTNDMTETVQFADQTVQNGTTDVTIGSIVTNDDYYVVITTANGTTIATTTTVNATAAPTDLSVMLDQPLTADTTLTATVYAAADDTVLATDDAYITVTNKSEELPTGPSFQDVLGVIEAFNNNEEFNGVRPGFQDVLTVIEAFNASQ